MTCISNAILREIDNQNIHYEKYKQMHNDPNVTNNGKRELLLRKMKNKDVS